MVTKGRVKVCCVSNRHHSPAFTASFGGLMGHSAVQGSLFERVGITMLPWQSCVSMGRQQGVEGALKDNATHILFTDDDMMFPPDALVQLFKHGKRIIGANYVRKVFPNSWVAKDLLDREIDSLARLSQDEPVELEPVGRIGLGLALINLDVFKTLPMPWFTNTWSFDRGHMTEDTYFCNQVRERGEHVWVDHRLSLGCLHAGEHLFGPRG